MKNFSSSILLRSATVALAIMVAILFSGCGPTTVGATYTAPGWAPGYADASSVPYYYFPDYDMYYDVGAGEYYYLNNGVWASSAVIPYAGIDLGSTYTVLLGRGTASPWLRNDYYARNYPAHAHEAYGSIARNNNLISNVPDGHAIVPRAYNENTNRVTFDERVASPSGAQARVGTHEVPMRSISPSMPPESRGYMYGGASRGR